MTASGIRVRLASPARWGTILVLAAGVTSCRPSPAAMPPLRPAAAPDLCALSEDSAEIPDTLTLALPGTVDPSHAPVPQTDAERMVFRQLYETLIRLDCAGTSQPGLAESWSAADSGRRWTFMLRTGAVFQDGQAVTAQDVIGSWMSRDTSLLEGAAAEARGDRTLELRFRRPTPMPPSWLADPALAVTRAIPGATWPVGTGPYRADTADGRVLIAPLFGGRRPTVVLPHLGSEDARDWLDRGFDLVVTDDPAAIGYATSRPEFATRALPWDRTYLLLTRDGAPTIAPAWRENLARDVVRVEARASPEPAWWTALPACLGPPPAGAPAPSVGPRFGIVFPRDDATARSLAERIVALESIARHVVLNVVPMDSAGLADLLAGRRVTGWQIVMPFSPSVLDPCRAVRELVARVPWATLASQVEPLIDTRRRVVWRRGAAAFTVDWDGVLRVR